MQTTLVEMGKPVDQLDELAFQLMVPLVAPVQLSVQAGGVAPLGVADTREATPAVPNDAAAMVTAMKALRNPTMISAPFRSDVCLQPAR